MNSVQLQYSAQASRALNGAQNEAERNNHSLIEPEHILLALIEEQSGLARFVLRALDVDLDALIIQVKLLINDIDPEKAEKPTFSDATKRVMELGIQSAGVLQRSYIGTEHLLIGMLRNLGSKVYPLLRKTGVTYTQVLNKVKLMPAESFSQQKQDNWAEKVGVSPGDALTIPKMLLMISPVFWGLLFATGLAGASAYYQWMDVRFSVFLFVIGGWVLSVSLHEFGHAIMAYWGGDYSVMNKGYLTLNPFRYTYGFLSIVLPLIYLAIGGIGLPGGAVYINMTRIKSRRMRSLVSVAGPVMTALFAIVLGAPFFLKVSTSEIANHIEFWSGLAFLVFLQFTALIFNLIPIPGLDGFGILQPYLPATWAARVRSFGSLTFILIFLLFFNDTPIRDMFWNLIGFLLFVVRVEIDLVFIGFELFKFWSG
ncbi:MAG: hypothetical protein N2D54_01845 [Chloroflexota bacterium]